MEQDFDHNLHTFLGRAIAYSGASGLVLYMMSLPVSMVLKILVVPLLALCIYGMYSCVRSFIQSLLPNPTPDELRPYMQTSGMQGIKQFPAFLRQLYSHKKYLAYGTITFLLAELVFLWVLSLSLASASALN